MIPEADRQSRFLSPPPASRSLGGDLARGLAAILHSQLPTGEIPVFRREAGGELSYSLCTMASTLVHDALGIFDPTAPRFDRAAVVHIPSSQRYPALATATMIRRRIHDFIAWQQGADGRWRFFGRSSGLGADAATTACAATVLLEGRGARRPAGRGDPSAGTASRWRRHVEALERYQADGHYLGRVDASGFDGSEADAEHAQRPDWTINAHVLRFLALAGEPVGPLTAHLQTAVETGRIAVPSPDYPEPMCFPHAVARAWRDTGLSGHEKLASKLVPRIFERQSEEGGFGNSLSTALAILALLDLDCVDSRLQAAGAALSRRVRSHGTWGYAPCLYHECGSASLTTAFCLAALGRLLGIFGELEAAGDV